MARFDRNSIATRRGTARGRLVAPMRTRLPFGAAPEDELILKILQVMVFPVFLLVLFDIPRVISLTAGGALASGTTAMIAWLWFVERRRHLA